ncbi:hypothetical protein [Desulfuromonas sp. TF]|uniref:hypothetical protein n=1 Tax=Desulfuromonas sp. TF TaxID=1232410 RepID=UPI0004892A28|nr:hypothetical protein [Desulfuromonas sp. TF]
MSKKISIHATDEQAEKFQEAKDLADLHNDKVSEILMQGVLPYIEAKKTEKVQLFIGNRFNQDGAPDGKYIAFQGKLLASGTRMRKEDSSSFPEQQSLYKTLKGQYLLYKNDDNLEFYHQVYPSVAKLLEEEELAIEIMKALEKDGSGVEWLDI